MRYLFVFQLYSGLSSSIKSRVWQPFGLPDVYKLIEKTSARNIPATVVLLDREEFDFDHVDEPTTQRFHDLDIDFRVIPAYRLAWLANMLFIPKRLRERVARIYNDLRQYHLVLREQVRAMPPSLIYVDRRNIVFGAIVALLGYPTVVRFHGVNIWNRFRWRLEFFLRQPLVAAALRAPFKLVLSSEDGSPATPFFGRALSSTVSYCVAVNGVDEPAEDINADRVREQYGFTNENWPILLFVGRLTPDKGIDEFLQAIVETDRRCPKFYVLIICGGGDPGPFSERMSAAGLGTDRVAFEHSVPHKEIGRIFRASDVYVSTNLVANLTNTVLEAIVADLCLVVLGRDPVTRADESTERLLPDDDVVRIPRTGIAATLSNRLFELVEDRSVIDHYREKTARLKQKIVWSWDQRMDFELDILERISNRRDWRPAELPTQVTGIRGGTTEALPEKKLILNGKRP